MRKKGLLVLLLLAAVLLPLAAAGSAEESGDVSEEMEPITFRIAHEDIADTVPDNYCKEFGRRLEEKTNGKIKTEVYPVGQLGVGVELLEQLLTGGIDMVIMNPGNTGTLIPEVQLFLLHYLLPTSIEDSFTFIEQSKALNENLNELFQKKNMFVVDWWSQGMMQWTTNKKITNPEDFEGVKIRTMQAPLIIANYKAYGANPTPIPYTEVYSALQLNMADAQENPIGPIEEMKFYEVQDYLIKSNHYLYMQATILNSANFQKLPENIQAAILETGKEMHSVAFDLQKANNIRAEEVLADDPNTQIVNLTEEEIEAFRKAALPVREHFVKTVGGESEEIMDIIEDELREFYK
ncbi:MAG: DctP family TRAP transporter solute-binding subunit [Spirochaetia bacterium]|nr:DctP family TRAP transporter solute-binding subunit [Spirochaetia bacterium]MCF7953174.1 DctP family TRAP transporter solute-binding subunit [Spirochaetales bacterium]